MNWRTTVVYLVILSALLGFYAYLRNREQPPAEITVTPEAVEETRYLFSPADGNPASISIVAKTGEAVEVARDADNAWRVIVPVEAAAEQGAAEAAASQVSSLRILGSVPDMDLELVGIAEPDYILNLKFANGKERTFKVGVVTPTESGYYVQDAAGGDVLILSKSSLDALIGMLTTPPYAETLTPSPIPTETPIPSATPADGTPVNETATAQS